MTGTIAFQGVPGAYSDLACRVAYADMTTLPCESFETAMDAVRDGRADLAMLPCENSLAGRVPDIHHLLPESGLFVIGEHFHRVEHCLLGVKGAAIGDLKRAHSHTVALGQVRHNLRKLGLVPVVQADTAGAAQLVAQWNRKEEAAIASIFANRVKERDALKAVVEAFNAVLPAKHGEEALADLKDRFSALVARNDNVPCHAALDAVQAYAKKGEARNIDESLRTYADFVGKEYALAQKHSQRK